MSIAQVYLQDLTGVGYYLTSYKLISNNGADTLLAGVGASYGCQISDDGPGVDPEFKKGGHMYRSHLCSRKKILRLTTPTLVHITTFYF